MRCVVNEPDLLPLAFVQTLEHVVQCGFESTELGILHGQAGVAVLDGVDGVFEGIEVDCALLPCLLRCRRADFRGQTVSDEGDFVDGLEVFLDDPRAAEKGCQQRRHLKQEADCEKERADRENARRVVGDVDGFTCKNLLTAVFRAGFGCLIRQRDSDGSGIRVVNHFHWDSGFFLRDFRKDRFGFFDHRSDLNPGQLVVFPHHRFGRGRVGFRFGVSVLRGLVHSRIHRNFRPCVTFDGACDREAVLDSVKRRARLEVERVVLADVFLQLRADAVLVPHVLEIILPLERSAEMPVCDVGDFPAVCPLDQEAPRQEDESDCENGEEKAAAESAPRLRCVDPPCNRACPDFRRLLRCFLCIHAVLNPCR